MSTKRFVFFLISLTIFLLALAALIIAMSLHAVMDDGSVVPYVIAIVSIALSVASTILIFMFGKGEK